MIHSPNLREGMRVRILGPASALGVTLATPFGTVLAPDEYAGYYLVRLDTPATYQHADGFAEPLLDIREFWDNLAIVEP